MYQYYLGFYHVDNNKLSQQHLNYKKNYYDKDKFYQYVDKELSHNEFSLHNFDKTVENYKFSLT